MCLCPSLSCGCRKISVWLLSDCQTAATSHHSREHAACVRSDLRADKEQMRLQLVVCWLDSRWCCCINGELLCLSSVLIWCSVEIKVFCFCLLNIYKSEYAVIRKHRHTAGSGCLSVPDDEDVWWVIEMICSSYKCLRGSAHSAAVRSVCAGALIAANGSALFVKKLVEG